ncbi:MAG: metallophosphoesterase, partial [bacterium]
MKRLWPIFLIVLLMLNCSPDILTANESLSDDVSQDESVDTETKQEEEQDAAGSSSANDTGNSDDKVDDTGTDTETETVGPVIVAFIGDQGLYDDAQDVITLILNEGTDMVLHQGDFDYEDDPDAWDDLITSILGDDFPYFASVGNHDVAMWDGYQDKLEERLARIDGAVCEGDLGYMSSCTYQNIFFILSGVGSLGEDDEHADYIEAELAQDDSIWRICSWH